MFSTLANATHAGAGAEGDIGAAKTSEFGNPQTRSNGNKQYRSISSANPSGEIGRRE